MAGTSRKRKRPSYPSSESSKSSEKRDVTKKRTKETAEEKRKDIVQEEELYNIEALVKKKGTKYLVKWEGFSSDENTWEPRSAIPPLILELYDKDPATLGNTILAILEQSYEETTANIETSSEVLEEVGAELKAENIIEEVEEEEVNYEVENILDKRTTNGKVEYLVKWREVGGLLDNSWELADTLQSYKDIIEKYEEKIEKYEEKIKPRKYCIIM